MNSSFSQYASKFLNGRLAPGSSLASSQPLFYSFQDSSDGEASTGRLKHSVQSRDDLELDDHGEPRLRGGEDIEDPYLRLDEDDGDRTFRESESAPLITSEVPSTQGGWLAHQTSPLPSRSPSPSTVSSHPNSPRLVVEQPPSRTALTESLLPRDGISRPVFSLSDRGRTPRHKYNDSNWTILWCTALSLCLLASLLTLFLTRPPAFPTPYSTLTRTVPLLTFLTALCTCISYAHILLLRHFARPMLIVTALFIPISMIISALFAFSGSFIYDGPLNSTTWGSTIGLRLFSLVPLFFAVLSARSIFTSIPRINSTVSTVKLATSLILSNPSLVAVSPSLLLVALLATLPFLSLIFRLFLVGYSGNKEWHVRPYATWLAITASIVWIWSWCVVRGILRVTAAGAVGSWFYKQNTDAANPDIGQLQATRAALSRAWGPSIGTICVSALLQALIGSVSLLLRGLRRLTSPAVLPPALHPLSIPIKLLSNTLTPFSFSGYTLPYAGLTGEAFLPSSRRAREVTSIKRPNIVAPSYTFISTLMTLSSLSLSTLLALSVYVFITHALSRPEHAFLGALLTGVMSFFVTWFCGGLVSDIADALYVCYCLDREAGTTNQQGVIDTFEESRALNSIP